MRIRLHDWSILPSALYRVFSLTSPASMQIYRNKRKRLHKKRVQLPEDWFGTPIWPPFHCFGTPKWLPWRHVKTLYMERDLNDYRPLIWSHAVLVDLRNCRLYENRNSYISDTKKVPKFPTKCFARLINWFSKRLQNFILPIIFC